MLIVVLLGIMLSVGGCAAAPHQSIQVEGDQASYFLQSQGQVDLRIKKFFDSHNNPTEMQKIEYLLESIRGSGATFIRNGDQYNSKQAAKWLAWKAQHPQYRDNPIVTGWDFVNRVADGSKASGWPYEIIVKDSRQRLPCQLVLSNELRALELMYVKKQVNDHPYVEEVSLDLEQVAAGAQEESPESLKEIEEGIVLDDHVDSLTEETLS